MPVFLSLRNTADLEQCALHVCACVLFYLLCFSYRYCDLAKLLSRLVLLHFNCDHNSCDTGRGKEWY